MAAGYKSGVNGTGTWNGTTIADLSNIRFEDDSNPQGHQTNTTGGKKRFVSGGDFKSGSFTILRDIAPFAKGASGTLVLKSDSGTELFNGLAYILSLNTNVQIDGGQVVGTEVQWAETVA